MLIPVRASILGLSLAASMALAQAPAFENSRLYSGEASDNAVVVWDEAILHGIRTTKPGPTIAARALAVAHTAMFDAWAAYDDRAVPTVPRSGWRRPAAERGEANKTEAVSYAGYRAATDLFPSEAAYYDALLLAHGYSPADGTTDVTTARGVGNAAAAAVLELRHRDGSNQLGDRAPGTYSDYTGYAPVNTVFTITDPNRWQPLAVVAGGAVVVQKFTTPQWGLVTPFALESGAALRPSPGPPMYPDPRYKQEADAVLAYGANLTDSQKTLAEYFADGPNSEFPPGHWALFAQFVSRRDAHGIDDDAKLFFALSNAMLDASICVWDAKRHFDYVRPISAIRFLYRGQLVSGWGGPGLGTVTMLGENWRPYQVPNVVTPPFPEFCSGHSAFSAAGAQILAAFTGSDAFGYSVRIPAGSSAGEPGIVPAADVVFSWPTFSAAAEDAGLSRRYGGIHFPSGDLTARAAGRQVGSLVWEKANKYFDGSAYPPEILPIRRARAPREIRR